MGFSCNALCASNYNVQNGPNTRASARDFLGAGTSSRGSTACMQSQPRQSHWSSNRNRNRNLSPSSSSSSSSFSLPPYPLPSLTMAACMQFLWNWLLIEVATRSLKKGPRTTWRTKRMNSEKTRMSPPHLLFALLLVELFCSERQGDILPPNCHCRRRLAKGCPLGASLGGLSTL